MQALALLTALAVAQATASAPAALPTAAELGAALDSLGDADLVVFEEARAGARPRVLAATRSRARAPAMRALLIDPRSYRRAVPSFTRAEVVKQEGATALIDWELEIPLWNLEGRLWLRPRPDGVDLQLVKGDLAPGHFQVTAHADGTGSLVIVAGYANLREANWVARRLTASSPSAEPAMTATAAWVLMRALVLEAEGSASHPRRRPRAAPGPPPAAGLDGGRLARACEALRPGPVVAAVRSRPDGRLAQIEVAVAAAVSPETFFRRVGEPTRWRALPGWKQLQPEKAAGPGRPPRWEVDSRFPFVDFDATWEVTPGPPFRALAVTGDGRGAVMGWDLAMGRSRGTTAAVFSLHARIETSGYVARKFVEAEPLLEHGLTLGLAYVDAVSLARAIAMAP